LALDSAFGSLSVAVAEGERDRFSACGDVDAKAAEALPGLVQSVLDGAGWRLSDLDYIAVTLGPGGFTALRAGLAFAKGLALGADKPLLGFTTLEAMAASLRPSDTPIVSVIDAKRDEVFFQVFDANMTPLSDAMVVVVERLGTAFNWPDAFRVCGSGASILATHVGKTISQTNVVVPDAVALARYCQKFEPQIRPAQAVYLRPADARPMA
jgi:tRNA threonylcarbamoyl adenosine modification protein YeaZ